MLGIRPEYVRVGAFGPMTVQATIRIVENLGATVLLSPPNGVRGPAAGLGP
ncbi:MAG: hypothetical protein IPF40_13720 [Actinomycetales bacterium]|uniref:Transport-associated OB type 2 domain-containing protein n=1 Tax=Candidatus Phosphoribacter hodrii TaxID=2953743 RepID=A0A934X6E3_9MICO|nr:hypothetical protein [Candidatus Phosphoribacter hodrii]